MLSVYFIETEGFLYRREWLDHIRLSALMTMQKVNLCGSVIPGKLIVLQLAVEEGAFIDDSRPMAT